MLRELSNILALLKISVFTFKILVYRLSPKNPLVSLLASWVKIHKIVIYKGIISMIKLSFSNEVDATTLHFFTLRIADNVSRTGSEDIYHIKVFFILG